ncbi:PQQ-binding-like beta-propeller repeat protein [Armatimonas sp.]|uniref:outer membrane protein assembly factor BamB family protein n=1 Tax=Armatimonas sp. TaxID=1872638 RepID=UPI003753DCCE
MKKIRTIAFAVGLTALVSVGSGAALADVQGWLNWRGPAGTGISQEKKLPTTLTAPLWSVKLAGGGTPVIANGKVYALGYDGIGADLQEVLLCADAETGKKLWEKRFSDYLSDITYDRYAIGSPTVDPETGNVYMLTSAGIFACFTADGKPVFSNAMMETLGRLTFTNGRTGAPTILDDLVIVRGITSNWGGDGAAMDRLYAFDKKNGKLVWSCSPGLAPKDNTFGLPIFSWRNGKQVFYSGAGDGSMIAVNARTGEPIWRYPISAGGMNATVVMYKNTKGEETAICVHADENIDASNAGRMTAVKVLSEPKPAEPLTPGAAPGPPVLNKSSEAWRNDDLSAVSSTPVLVGRNLYLTDKTGFLDCVDAETGKILWKQKLAPDQLHASPTYAEGKLYVPFQNGLFYILKPGVTGAQVLAKTQLAGRCIGAPSVYNGKVYVFSTERLYCYGKPGGKPMAAIASVGEPKKFAGPTVALQIVPSEVILRPGEKVKLSIRGIDANGFVTETFDASKATFEQYVPPTAKVRALLDAKFENGEIVGGAKSSAGAYQATLNGFKGIMRGRVLTALPYTEDFESFNPTEQDTLLPEAKFAYPPLPWIGARFKFDVRELEGNKVFAKTLDNIFFQRATVFFGHPDEKNYTFEADVMVDGNRRTKSTVGLINQRYYIILNGNADELEVNSNQERIKATVPFKIQSKTWYRMKTRVDVAASGSGMVRAKVWKKEDPEPTAWTIEVPHKSAHTVGAPGLFGFAPQSLYKVYIDNISVKPN